MISLDIGARATHKLSFRIELNYSLFINKRCYRFALYLRLKIYIPQRLLNHPQKVSVCTIKETKTSHSRFILVFLPLNEPLCTAGSSVEISFTLCKSPEQSPKRRWISIMAALLWERNIKKFVVFLAQEETILAFQLSFLILLKNWFGRGINRWV